MRHTMTVLLLVMGVLTATPVQALVDPSQLQAYGVSDPAPAELTLLQHRAVYQLLLGAALVWAALRPDVRVPVAVAAMLSKGIALAMTVSRPEVLATANPVALVFDPLCLLVLGGYLVHRARRSRHRGRTLAAVAALPVVWVTAIPASASPPREDFAPVAWRAPDTQVPAELSETLEPDGLGDPLDGPEDLVVAPDGDLLTGDRAGTIWRIDPETGAQQVFAEVGGRPLGLAFAPDGSLLVANHGPGLQRVDPDGTVELLVAEVDGRPLAFANELTVSSDGIVYVSDSSARHNRTTIGPGENSYLFPDAVEGRASGRVVAHDLNTGRSRVVVDGLFFPNGVALLDDRRLVVAESTRYRLLELDPTQAEPEPAVLLDVPGTPDNLTVDGDGNLLVAMYDPSVALDRFVLPWTATRHLISRLPTEWFVNSDDPLTGHVLVVSPDGTVLAQRTGVDPAPSSIAVVGDTWFVGALLEQPVRTAVS